MAWILLFIAAILEVAWAVSLRYTDGYTQLWPSVTSTTLVAANVYILSLAFKDIPSSIAYPIWVGLGVIGTVFMSHMLFKDNVTALNILFIGLILIGIVGLKVTAA